MAAKRDGQRGHDALKSRHLFDHFGVNLGMFLQSEARVPHRQSARHTCTCARKEMWGGGMMGWDGMGCPQSSSREAISDRIG
jgi:hypothetical protein